MICFMCLDSADLQAAPFDAKSHRFEAAGMVQGDGATGQTFSVQHVFLHVYMCTPKTGRQG